MARPITQKWASPGNLSVMLTGHVDDMEHALWELHELHVTCAYDPWGTSPTARMAWGDNPHRYRLATFSVEECDRQRVYQFASRRRVRVEVETAPHDWYSQGFVPFRLAQVVVRQTPDSRFLKSATYRKRFYRPPEIIDSVKVVFDVRSDIDYPLYLEQCQKLPHATATLPGARLYCVIDTPRGDIAELLTNLGLKVRLYALGAEKPWHSGGTLVTYFRGNAQLAALLRKTRFADTRIAHGLPDELELTQTLWQIQYHADRHSGRIPRQPVRRRKQRESEPSPEEWDRILLQWHERSRASLEEEMAKLKDTIQLRLP